jgi:serine/threonine protein kinase/DNA-directed RNA polymerase subunit RPC12/RpoP
MRLKCPRCSTQFQGETDEKGYIACPSCNARLKLRPKETAPEAAEGSAAGTNGPAAASDDGADAAAQSANKAAGEKSARDKDKDKDVTLPPGTRLGGFELRRVLGRGGMATVYKAVQLSLNRPVAVKLLAPRFASSPVFVERFDREAGALATLNHPNIVNIIDKGVEDGKHYYFVMEYVEGITLDQLMHAVELTERHYTHIIAEISKALTYVHGRGIIHRDIKPSNILVDKPGNVKVSDFGIAHIAEGDAPTERFGRNATVGTMNYMAPEQAANPGAVDMRADVYSLGVTFYKMFTKQLPVGEWKPPTLLNPNLPRTVDSVLARAVQPHPADRYPSVKEFCDELITLFAAASNSSTVGVDLVTSLAPGGVGAFSFGSTLNTSSTSSGTSYAVSADSTDSSASGSAFRTGSLSDSSFGSSPGFGSSSVLRGVMGAPPPGAADPEPVEDEKPSRAKLYISIAAGVLVLAAIAGGVLWYLNA